MVWVFLSLLALAVVFLFCFSSLSLDKLLSWPLFGRCTLFFDLLSSSLLVRALCIRSPLIFRSSQKLPIDVLYPNKNLLLLS